MQVDLEKNWWSRLINVVILNPFICKYGYLFSFLNDSDVFACCSPVSSTRCPAVRDKLMQELAEIKKRYVLKYTVVLLTGWQKEEHYKPLESVPVTNRYWAMMVKLHAQGNKRSLWWGLNSRLADSQRLIIRKGFHSFQGWYWGLTEIYLLHDDAQNITKQ